MATDLDPAIATDVAGKHVATGESITGQETAFANAIIDLNAKMKGSMARALQQASEEWCRENKRVVSELKQMAENVLGAKTDISEQDETNAAGVASVATNILAGLN